MKKKILAIASAFLCCTTMFGVGCGDKNVIYNPETERLRLAISALEGNYNPFFYTAANDGEIAAMTQLPLMTIDEEGHLAVGENEACVALDYKVTTYDAREGGSPTANGTMDGRTEYEIIIKNGIKFSDGEDLTIDDVLFNFYVYLDPAYVGSSTIYSTDIKGLKAYRAQDPSIEDNDDISSIDTRFATLAQARIDSLIEWSVDSGSSCNTNDLATVIRLFEEEATNDWNTYETGWVDAYGPKSKYSFTAAWQAYLFAEGLVKVQERRTLNGTEQVEENDKYLTTLDPNAEGVGNLGEVQAQYLIDEIDDATTEAKITSYLNSHSSATREEAILQLQKECCLELVIGNYTNQTNIADVLRYWATGTNVLTEFTADERSQYYDRLTTSVDSISGITTDTTSVDFEGNELGEEHDVLKIVINGIDPKAVWNFCFSVAPLHYYSGVFSEDHIDYSIVDRESKFGVKVGDSDFYTEVIRSTAKNGLPVGAGSYKASNQRGEEAENRNQFSENNVVYFMRNDYFNTVGDGIENAKIKYVTYQVMPDARIVEALKTHQIDYAEPNATSDNQADIEASLNELTYKAYRTGGYGYVGINPKFVPNITVRRAIMKVLDVNETIKYYGRSLAEQIYRPMSLTSWVYEHERDRLTTEYKNIAFTDDDQDIINLLSAAGYTRNSSGILANGTDVLKYTFTVAGESSDHPAYQMFTLAAERLNSIGFDITVQTDISALSKLNTGSLDVWAAAWTSSIDPDMYQVYHKDSKATSVNNWNYPAILRNTNNAWQTENSIVQELSKNIDLARQKLDEQERSAIYVDCLNNVMELAIEFPTYQRRTLAVYNKRKLDPASLTQRPSHNLGLIGKIWEVDYLK